MRKPKINVLLGSLIIVGVGCLVLASIVTPRIDTRSPANASASRKSTKVSKQPTPQDRHEYKSRFSKTDFDAAEPSDPVEKVKRKNKGKHFDKMNIVSREPTRYWSLLITEWDVGLPAIPVAQSSAVLIVEALTSEAHLSEDKTGVYTEFSARVEEVLKTPDPLITKDGLVNVSRRGGIVRYRSGEESLCSIKGQNMPRVGKRYLLFLKSIAQSKDFEIVTGYEIDDGKVSPLDDPEQFRIYKGVTETMFLKTVREAITG